MTRDVMVTGLGAVTSVGGSASSTWAELQTGTSGAETITRFDTDGLPQCPDLACEVPIDPTDHEAVDERRMGRYSQFAAIATEEALEDAGLSPGDSTWDPEAVGVSVGTGIGGLPELESGALNLDQSGRVSTRFMLNVLPNLMAGYLSIRHDAGGPNRAKSTACAAGAHSIIDAIDDIRLGRADVMIAGGAESAISPLGIAGFGAMRALSTRADAPTEASRPFETARDGFVMGEGAGILVIESREHAEARGATPLAELSGGGLSGDSAHPTKPHADAWGLRRAMEMALDDAGRSPDAVDLVNAHGTSTPEGDAHEAMGINTVFETTPPVTAPKSMLGHSLGASGAIEAVLSVQAIGADTIPPTINHDTRGDACDVPVVESCTERPVDVVMSNSAGFGGTNAVIVAESP